MAAMIDPGEDTSGFSNAMVGSSHGAATSPQAVAEGVDDVRYKDSQHGRFLNSGELSFSDEMLVYGGQPWTRALTKPH